MIPYTFDMFLAFPARRAISLTVCVSLAYDEGGEAKRGVAAMAREIYVSRRDGICKFSSEGKRLQYAALEGAGALCVGKEQLFCALDEGYAIVRLDPQTLMQQTVFSGGPGIVQLMLSVDGLRLYALCADADSVLMLDAQSGTPLIVCRVGCNPQQMALCDGVLAVAGGESGCVHLLDMHSLEPHGCLSMPGPVYSASLRRNTVHALCLTQTLDAQLVTDTPAGRVQLALSGMPGRILTRTDELLVSSNGRLYAVSADGRRVLREEAAPGRAAALMAVNGQVLLRDMISERLLVRGAGGIWKLLSAETRCVSA